MIAGHLQALGEAVNPDDLAGAAVLARRAHIWPIDPSPKMATLPPAGIAA
ncbi:MAG TPA: hypothetical protein VKB03_02360 [Conexibacter sp.]|nr:hypothetical protein [Conexibacter sp.]